MLVLHPRRMAAVGGAATAAALGYAFAVDWYVSHASTQVAVNLVLMAGQFFGHIAVGATVAVAFASARFGEAWVRRKFLGERPAADDGDDEIHGVRDHTLSLYAVGAAAAVAMYALVAVATDDYMRRYDTEGHFLTQLRSADRAEQIRGIRAFADPVRRAASGGEAARQALVGAIDAHDPEVRAWAAWASGVLMVQQAAPALIELLSAGDEPERVEAAIAIGRLADPLGERALAARLSAASSHDERMAVIVGLGLMASTRANEALLEVARGPDDQLAVAALWALGRSRSTALREPVLALWQSSAGERRCAAAEAMKHVTTVADDAALRAAFATMDRGTVCARQRFVGRSYHDDHVAAPEVLVVEEELRMKYLKAVFNIGGPELETWLVDVAWTTEETTEMKVLADQLAQALKQGPPRQPRE